MRSSNTYQTSVFCVLADPRETRRVDTYLSALFPEKSRSYIQKMIEEGKIQANGENFTKNKKIYRGDEIQIEWKIEAMHLEAESIPLEIVYENADFAIINKDPGINTHPTPGESGRHGTLVNALLHHFSELGTRMDEQHKKVSGSIINGVEKPGIVHRLDKDTSGLLVIAKNDKTMHALQLKIEKRTIRKTYLALVAGIVAETSGYIESYIGRDPHVRNKMTTKDPLNPKLAKTRFKKLQETEGKYTLLEIDLLTGRTHQIRVHLASIGFPIVGDSVYGIRKVNQEATEKYGLKRQWLHAWKLDFNLSGTEYTFTGPIKEDLKQWNIHIPGE